MILHPDLLADLAHLHYQDRLREVETWRLAAAARQNRAKFLGRLLHRLVAAVRQQLSGHTQPDSVTPNLADLHG